MVTFQKVKIRDLPIIIGDGNYSSKYPKASDFTSEGVPFISNKDIKQGKILSEELRYISPKQHLELKKGHLKEGDVIISTRANIGDVAWVRKNFEDANINAQLVFLRTDEKVLHNRYLYFLLSSKKYKSITESFSGGSAQSQLPIKDLIEIPIEFPEYSIQTRVASVLSAYDDLIEINEKRIRALEEMASRLYIEWFVKFKFPGHEKVKMVDSGTEFGMIPEGWGVNGLLSSKFFLLCKDRIKRFDGEKFYFDTSCIDGIKISKEPLSVSWDILPGRAQFAPVYHSVWFARMSNTYKVLVFDTSSGLEVSKYILSSGMLGLKTEDKYLGFLFALIKSKLFHRQKDSKATGATQVSLTDEGFAAIRVLFPTLHLIEEYSKVANEYVGQILALQRQNNTLSKIRNLIVPLLVTGKRELK